MGSRSRRSSRAHTRISSPTIRRTSTARAKSPPVRTRFLSAFSIGIRTCRATRTFAMPGRCAHPSISAWASRRNSTVSRCGRRMQNRRSGPHDARERVPRHPNQVERADMDMAATFHEQRVFFSTSRRQGEGVDAIDGLGLRPALFAGYRDLSLLRHDFPLVLVAGSSSAGTVRSLSGIVDEALLEVAPRGIEGERLRKHALALEREIRARVAAGDTALLEELWTAAAERVSAVDEENAEEVLRYTAAALKLDGEVDGCDVVMPAKFLAHLWEAARAAKAHAFRQAVDTLVVRLSDILRAAFIHSAAGQQP